MSDGPVLPSDGPVLPSNQPDLIPIWAADGMWVVPKKRRWWRFWDRSKTRGRWTEVLESYGE